MDIGKRACQRYPTGEKSSRRKKEVEESWRVQATSKFYQKKEMVHRKILRFSGGILPT